MDVWNDPLIIRDNPMENPVTKFALYAGVAYVAFLLIRSKKAEDKETPRHKHRQHYGMGYNAIDQQIARNNRAHGGKVKANPDIPYYSRNNVNRRRQTKSIYV